MYEMNRNVINKIALAACTSLLMLSHNCYSQTRDAASEVDKLATTNSPFVIKGKPGREKASHGPVFEIKEFERVQKQVDNTIKTPRRCGQNLYRT